MNAYISATVSNITLLVLSLDSTHFSAYGDKKTATSAFMHFYHSTDDNCYWYSTFNNSAKKWYFSIKFRNHFRNLLGIKCTKRYLDSFRFSWHFYCTMFRGLVIYRTQCKHSVLLYTCIQISGIMGLTTAFTSYRNTHAHTYRLLVIGPSESDVIGLSCISLVLIGLFNLLIGVFKTAQKCALSTNQVCASKCSLCLNLSYFWYCCEMLS